MSIPLIVGRTKHVDELMASHGLLGKQILVTRETKPWVASIDGCMNFTDVIAKPFLRQFCRENHQILQLQLRFQVSVSVSLMYTHTDGTENLTPCQKWQGCEVERRASSTMGRQLGTENRGNWNDTGLSNIYTSITRRRRERGK